ncbi:MAG: thiamine pyrophosphate-requiring protein [Halobacteriales archaeon]
MADPTGGDGVVEPTAAGRLLRSLRRRGVDHVFANFGTDHTPLIEAAARLRDAGRADNLPEFVTAPHEFAAMSAAHGYAAATGDPQAVLVHVDVGTQNLGSAVHNAHRANVPVLVVAGLAPVTHAGHQGSRDIAVHYFQDVFDQAGIVREYCRWAAEYRPPADPTEFVARALDRATGTDPGPVYLSATREALETAGDWPEEGLDGTPQPVERTAPGADTVESLVDSIQSASAPLLVTSRLGREPEAEARVRATVRFAETAGAGVVEHAPTVLSFPRDHELHAGFDPSAAFEHADLVLLADVDVPWIPADGGPAGDVPVLQVEADPTKRTYPQWPFAPDERYAADPARTLAAVADRLDPADGEPGRSRWSAVAADRRVAADERVEDARSAGRLTPAVLSAAVDEVVDDRTVVVEDGVTSKAAILEHVRLDRPGSYHAKGGAGLGWAGGAGVGVALGRPEARVVTLVGDGAYLFSHPSVCAWLAAEHDAPTLTVVYDNRGWRAVETATAAEHPQGAAVAAGVPESHFGTELDLTAPAQAVEAVTRRVTELEALEPALADGVAAVDDGRPAVVSVAVERPDA